MTEVIPDLPDSGWPIDTGCCSEFEQYDPKIQERAKALAGQTMRMLTAYRVGGPPVTVRPCRAPRATASGWYATDSGFMPVLLAGSWVNMVCCGVSSCGCSEVPTVVLPGPVGRVDQVKIDGQVVPASAYRVDDGRLLVRTDGQQWPLCQDMVKPDTQAGTFSVTYLKGISVDGLGAYAAGILACEYAKACSGAKCRLPSGVETISRQGITMTLTPGAFPNGRTGIREVDAYLAYWNPYSVKAPSTVWSPDLTSVRHAGA